MAPITGQNGEKYEVWYVKWTEEQKEYVKELRNAVESDMKEEEVRQLVAKVLEHYKLYYDVKDRAARGNVLQLLQPSWRSPLETALLWIGGWRPSMVFQLAYAQSGHQMQQELAELIKGVESPTMASLSARQLTQISELQVKTQQEEEALTQQMAVLQQSLVDQPLLGLALAGTNEEEMKGAFADKFEALENMLLSADKLRYSSLAAMLKILNPVQGAHYLLAAGLLQSTIRTFGEAQAKGDGGDDGGDDD